MNEVRIHKTGEPEIIQSSDGRLTLSVPIQFKRRAGRKQAPCVRLVVASFFQGG